MHICDSKKLVIERPSFQKSLHPLYMACPPRHAFQIGWICALQIEAAAATIVPTRKPRLGGASVVATQRVEIGKLLNFNFHNNVDPLMYLICVLLARSM